MLPALRPLVDMSLPRNSPTTAVPFFRLNKNVAAPPNLSPHGGSRSAPAAPHTLQEQYNTTERLWHESNNQIISWTTEWPRYNSLHDGQILHERLLQAQVAFLENFARCDTTSPTYEVLKNHNVAGKTKEHVEAYLLLLTTKLPSTSNIITTFILTGISELSRLVATVPTMKSMIDPILERMAVYGLALELDGKELKDLCQSTAESCWRNMLDKQPEDGALYVKLGLLNTKFLTIAKTFNVSKGLCTRAPSAALPIKTIRHHFGRSGIPILLQDAEEDDYFASAVAILLQEAHLTGGNDANSQANGPSETPDLDLHPAAAHLAFKMLKSAFLMVWEKEVSDPKKVIDRAYCNEGAKLASTLQNGMLGFGTKLAGTDDYASSLMAVLMSDLQPAPATSHATHWWSPSVDIWDVAGESGKFLAEMDAIMFASRPSEYAMPYTTTRFAFVLKMLQTPGAMEEMQRSSSFDFVGAAEYGNSILKKMKKDLTSKSGPKKEVARHVLDLFMQKQSFPPCKSPLPEDWDLQGHIWAMGIFPSEDHQIAGPLLAADCTRGHGDWFVQPDGRPFSCDTSSPLDWLTMEKARFLRALYLLRRIAVASGPRGHLAFNARTSTFYVPAAPPTAARDATLAVAIVVSTCLQPLLWLWTARKKAAPADEEAQPGKDEDPIDEKRPLLPGNRRQRRMATHPWRHTLGIFFMFWVLVLFVMSVSGPHKEAPLG